VHWFYDPSLSAETATLPSAEAQHAKSLRIRMGEEISLTNGAGLVSRAQVLSEAPFEFSISHSQSFEQAKFRFHLIQALAKNDRDELALQAAVELGATQITPWQSARSIVRWDGKEEKNKARWQQIALEAMKQSQQPYLPSVNPVTKTKDLKVTDGIGLVLDPRAKNSLSDIEFESGLVTLVVGPEGGISLEELGLLEANGFKPVRLGVSVLRASTAGPAAIAAISALTGNWN